MQLEFSWRDADMLRAELEEQTGLRVHLAVTDNTSTVMTVKQSSRGGEVRVRLHHMFLSASPEVLCALARWITSSNAKKAGEVLDEFIRGNTERIRQRPRQIVAKTEGIFFDLGAIFERLNAEYFEGKITAMITWGRMPSSRRRRSIRFGSFYPRENLIRIHPLLDQDFVPLYFVEYIVFHEMLHAFLGIDETDTGRRRLHGGAFKRHEVMFDGYLSAMAWQNDARNLRKLLRRRPVEKHPLEGL